MTVLVYKDDILVYGKSAAEHDSRLAKVLQTLDEVGLKLNHDKCAFRQPELKLLGHVFSQDGILADPDKVEAILRMQPPKNVPELRRFMGIVHYWDLICLTRILLQGF